MKYSDQKEFLNGIPGTFGIYQMHPNNENLGRVFSSIDFCVDVENLTKEEFVASVKADDYVFHGGYDAKDLTGMDGDKVNSGLLEEIYFTFNMKTPADFNGHSMSVSDVIVVHDDDGFTAWYVDSIGFEKLPNFLKFDERFLVFTKWFVGFDAYEKDIGELMSPNFDAVDAWESERFGNKDEMYTAAMADADAYDYADWVCFQDEMGCKIQFEKFLDFDRAIMNKFDITTNDVIDAIANERMKKISKNFK